MGVSLSQIMTVARQVLMSRRVIVFGTATQHSYLSLRSVHLLCSVSAVQSPSSSLNPSKMSKRVVKTLYTAKFYESPSSSEFTRPSPPQPSAAYLENLFHAHVALNQMEEVPSSHTYDAAHAQRVEALREKVLDVYNAASGNPASGKWGLLANLLRTGTSKGKYRYINTRTDAVPPQPGPEGWLLAETEEEWLAWEEKRKREQQPSSHRQRKEDETPMDKKRKEEQEREQLLKEKVETWKREISSDLDNEMLDTSSPLPTLPAKGKAKKSFPSSDGITSKSAAPSSRTRATSEIQEVGFVLVASLQFNNSKSAFPSAIFSCQSPHLYAAPAIQTFPDRARSLFIASPLSPKGTCRPPWPVQARRLII